MPSVRSFLIAAVVGLLPSLALAQATAPAPQTSAAMTQNAPVTEPDMGALKPPPPPAMTMPHWAEFPIAPKDVPTVSDFAKRVHTEEDYRAQLDTLGRAIVWEVFEPNAIAAAVNAQIDPSKMGPVDQELTSQQSEALAQSLRDKATAPPVAQ